MLVQTDQLSKHYGEVAALTHCTLGVERGEVFGLLGPNGAGKTTLLRLLLGYLRPTAGTATIDGLDCYRDSVEVHRRVSYMPGEARMFRAMRGSEALKFFTGLRGGERLETGLQLAKRLDLDLSRRVAFMSTGMRQKLALAVAVAADTPLLVLDEPTSHLDPSVRSEVLRLTHEAQDEGRTVLFSSHVLSEVEEVCDRVAILRRGELVHTQNMHALRRQHRIRAQLRGTLTAPPPQLEGELKIVRGTNGDVVIESPGELSPLLGWLATLPLAEVKIEPIGLRAIYDRFHGEPSTSLLEEKLVEDEEKGEMVASESTGSAAR